MENEWLGELCRLVNLDRAQLPVIWDADFLYGPKDPAGADSYVLCEINVSSVFPFPDDALAPLAENLQDLKAHADREDSFALEGFRRQLAANRAFARTTATLMLSDTTCFSALRRVSVSLMTSPRPASTITLNPAPKYPP